MVLRLVPGMSIAFPRGADGKKSTCNEGDLGSIPGLGRSSGEGKGYPLQYSGLEHSMDCIVHGVTKSRTRLSGFHFHFRDICGRKRRETKEPLDERKSEKVGLKLNIQKAKIMASGPITSWQIDGKFQTIETVTDFIFLGSKIRLQL